MAALFVIVWLVPALWGAFAGWWRAARPALSPKDFLRDIGVALITAAIPIFMFHMVWVAAFREAVGAFSSVGWSASYWTFVTGVIWVPLMVIAYIWRAMKIRNADAGKP